MAAFLPLSELNKLTEFWFCCEVSFVKGNFPPDSVASDLFMGNTLVLSGDVNRPSIEWKTEFKLEIALR